MLCPTTQLNTNNRKRLVLELKKKKRFMVIENQIKKGKEQTKKRTRKQIEILKGYLYDSWAVLILSLSHTDV